MKKLKKGSPEAKAYMAKLRELSGKGKKKTSTEDREAAKYKKKRMW
jgi:hypothetical protein